MTCISSWEAFPDRNAPLPDYPLTQEDIDALSDQDTQECEVIS